ncbi:DUF429 domain-containing protein [Paenibacillus sp. Marseille-Q7038]
MKIIGLDLAGTTNSSDTAVAIFEYNVNSLTCIEIISDLTDSDIYDLVKQYANEDQVIIGIDAPLSYQFGGGDRLSDKSLRKLITEIGMRPGSIMAPTSPKMSYLTLRGINVSRGLYNIPNVNKIQIVEVHPGATIGLHYGQPIVPQEVLDYKDHNNILSRNVILAWLMSNMFLNGINNKINTDVISSHEVDACVPHLRRGNGRILSTSGNIYHQA